MARLLAGGMNDCAIARATGIPRSTIKDWRVHPHGTQMAGAWVDCLRCGTPMSKACAQPLRRKNYAYLLGVYLGDGHIAAASRGVWRLRIFCDARYPGLIETIAEAIGQIVPGHTVDRRPASRANPGCTVVSAYWKRWPCVFPQHGAGRKHQRRILLEPWQKEIVDEHPDQLVRGLIHTDGWRGSNHVMINGERRPYGRYQFCQVSDDIRRLFCDALDALDVPWRRMTAYVISIARREAVARLDEFIEPKA